MNTHSPRTVSRLALLAACAAALAGLSACYVVPVDPRTGQAYPPGPYVTRESSGVTVVTPPAPSAPPQPGVLSVRLYPLNPQANQGGMLNAVVVDSHTGRGSFDSAYPYDPPRTNNMTLGAAAVNGTLIKPGEVFSLNKVMGERTSAKGYQEAGVISNNRLTKNVGGGVSQISTVTYNLAWFAGVELTAHKAHSFYISRYPAGREATVSWPDLDNKWTNNSPYGILVQMWLSGGQVHGRMWSTKVYDVTAVAGPRTNIKHGRSITDSSPSCVPHAFTDGFDITVQRVFSKGGSVVKRESYSPTSVFSFRRPDP